jgi:hypothetical protein
MQIELFRPKNIDVSRNVAKKIGSAGQELFSEFFIIIGFPLHFA